MVQVRSLKNIPLFALPLGFHYICETSENIFFLASQVTFVLLGFLCMLGMEAVGLYFEGVPASPTPSCIVDPTTFKNISTPVSITCSQGVVTILPEQSENKEVFHSATYPSTLVFKIPRINPFGQRVFPIYGYILIQTPGPCPVLPWPKSIKSGLLILLFQV